MFVTQDGLDDADMRGVMKSGYRQWGALTVPPWSPSWFVVTYEDDGFTDACLAAALVSSTEKLQAVLNSTAIRITAVSLMTFERVSRGWKQSELSNIWFAKCSQRGAPAEQVVLAIKGDQELRTRELTPFPYPVKAKQCLSGCGYALAWQQANRSTSG